MNEHLETGCQWHVTVDNSAKIVWSAIRRLPVHFSVDSGGAFRLLVNTAVLSVPICAAAQFAKPCFHQVAGYSSEFIGQIHRNTI